MSESVTPGELGRRDFLIVARGLPPFASAGAHVWGHLLQHTSAQFRSRTAALSQPPKKVDDMYSPVATVLLKENIGGHVARYGWRWGVDELWNITSVYRGVVSLGRQLGVRYMILGFPSTSFLVGGYLAARRLGLPYSVYFHDLFRPSRRNAGERMLGAVYEKRVIRNAQSRFMLTPGLRAYYEKKYGCPAILLPHTLDKDTVPSSYRRLSGSEGRTRVIVFAGNAHAICEDALIVLARALQMIREVPAKLVVTGYLDKERFDQFSGLVEHRFFEERMKLREFLSDADILYNPVGFHTPYPKQASTCFPTKTLDYLVAGRPTLVHAPRDSDLMRFARETGSGLVVDSDDPSVLAGAVVRLLTDEALQEELVRSAFSAAERFDGEEVGRQFEGALLRSLADKEDYSLYNAE